MNNVDGLGGGRPLLSIGDFARRTRLSPKALRIYDDHGILVPAHIDPDTGYRRYAEGQLHTARLVAQLRRLDMPLSQVAEVLAVSGSDAGALVAEYWRGVEGRVASQRELARFVEAVLSGDSLADGLARPRVRHVPEQTWLTEQRYVTVADLEAVIGESTTRLMGIADRHAARAGEFTFVFHGEVTEDSDGPVEFCLPVHAETARRAGVPTRAEPAHREAYVRLTQAQASYPQILSAYDAVFEWMAHEGKTWAGPPREVYLGSFPDAAPDEEICDVALPFS